MAGSQVQTQAVLPERSANIGIPLSLLSLPNDNPNSRLRSRLALDTFSSPVNQNGSFEFDRVLKSGYVQKRTQKTKAWKTIYLVLRPNALSIYKTEKEDKLRHKIYLSDLTAVSLLKDPKQKRKNVFGLFSPARNWHFQSSNAKDGQEWVDLIRKYARIEEEEEEMLLASPIARQQSYMGMAGAPGVYTDPDRTVGGHERLASSSPEPHGLPAPPFISAEHRQPSHIVESSGYSGNELASHSDFSDSDIQRVHGMSIENLAVQSPAGAEAHLELNRFKRPDLVHRNTSQISGLNVEHDPDRVIWQGWLWLLRSKGGVRQWKNLWAVLRPRNLILYKDESEYTAQFIVHLSAIVNVVDIDPVSKTKAHCLQVITEEKSYRFCAPDEESLVQCLGAFKSLLSKRRELEGRTAGGGIGNLPTV